MPDSNAFFFREQPKIETARLRIRAIRMEDAASMFAMDSDPQVHRFLGNRPAETIEQVQETIRGVLEQYRCVGIGRWAVEDRESREFLGWTGFKWMDEVHVHRGFLDLGYRFLRIHWGRGLATESAKACLEFAAGSPVLEDVPIRGMVAMGNVASARVLEKLGMRPVDTFQFLDHQVDFYEP